MALGIVVWLPESNRGYQLLASMGWKEDSGLGPKAQGRVEPIATVFKTDRQGVGAPSMAKRHARVTHFPAHDERQQQISADGLSDAQCMQERLTRKRKQEPMDIMPLSKAQRKAQTQRDSKRDRAIGRELYSTGLEGYEQYLS